MRRCRVEAAPRRNNSMTNNALVRHAESFNSALRRLTVDLYARSREPGADATLWRARERVMLAIDQSPLFCIDRAGDYLYRYRDQIYSRDEKFLAETDYDRDLKAGTNAGRVDLVRYIIPRAKQMALALSPEDRGDYFLQVQAMLDDYIEYLALRELGRAGTAH